VKARYVRAQSINILNAPPGYRDQAKPVMQGSEIVDWVIPAGTIVEGDEALCRVSTGQAEPADEECAAACGMSVDQLRVRQRASLMEDQGIRSKKDRELFMANVIEGYAEGTTDEKPVYIPGPKWQAFQDAKAAADKESDI
jgi:hypothetical protein